MSDDKSQARQALFDLEPPIHQARYAAETIVLLTEHCRDETEPKAACVSYVAAHLTDHLEELLETWRRHFEAALSDRDMIGQAGGGGLNAERSWWQGKRFVPPHKRGQRNAAPYPAELAGQVRRRCPAARRLTRILKHRRTMLGAFRQEPVGNADD